ncbi:hypothetical protein KFU94_70385 [Chloroflexi bacterium TSY]|nr:hypothetical protein [Chloroflexi bacterium TSY]
MLSSFTLSFLAHYLLDQENDYPAVNLEQFPEARLVDVSYVQQWAYSQRVIRSSDENVQMQD